MITPEQHAEIRRLYYGEHWKVGTIAAALGVHHDTVRAAIVNDTQGVRRGTCRATQLDPYLPFIRDTLAQYPRLRATRLFEMVKGARLHGLGRAAAARRPPDPAGGDGHGVSPPHHAGGGRSTGRLGRVWLDPDRPRRPPALRLCDGALVLARHLRALHGRSDAREFSPRPCRGLPDVAGRRRAPWSTTICAAPSSNAPAPRFAFIRGCSSSPATITSRRGRVRRAAGNEKGKVERQIQYLRHAFFAARTFVDVDDLNAQFRRWRDEVAHQRPHPEQRDRTVAEVLAEEQPRLLPLPAHPFETDVMRTVVSGKTPYVRFDRNQLLDSAHARAAPADAAREPDDRARDRRHRRDRAPRPQLRHRPDHRAGGACRRARRGHAPGQSVECARPAPPRGAGRRHAARAPGRAGRIAARITVARLLALLDDYGPQELAAAIDRALERDALGAGAIAHILETRRRQRGLKPPIPIALPDRPGVRDLDVTPHRLETYDDLTRSDPDDAE